MTSYKGSAHVRFSVWAKISAARSGILILTGKLGQDQNPDLWRLVQVSSSVAFFSRWPGTSSQREHAVAMPDLPALGPCHGHRDETFQVDVYSSAPIELIGLA